MSFIKTFYHYHALGIDALTKSEQKHKKSTIKLKAMMNTLFATENDVSVEISPINNGKPTTSIYHANRNYDHCNEYEMQQFNAINYHPNTPRRPVVLAATFT